MIRLLLSLFLTGLFLGAGPCLLSCGPLLVSYIVATKESPLGGLKTYLLFSLTRFLVYVFFGVLVGVFGQEILYRFFDSVFLKIIFYCFGFFVLLLGILLAIEKFPFASCCAGLNRFFFATRDSKNIIVFGLIVAFSPCLPLVAVLGYIALLADHWLKGVFMMAAFGLGTILSPMILISMAAGRMKPFLSANKNVFRWVKIGCGVLLAFLGVYLILRAQSLSFPRINY